MIIKVGGPDKDKLLNLLKKNDILYKDVTYRLFDELIGLEVTEIIDGDEEEILFTLSEKELAELKQFVADSFMDYDYTYQNDFIRDCIREWMNERGAK